MTPKQFLQVAGIILIMLAMIGFLRPYLAGSLLYFDPAENWAHMFLGILAFLLAPMQIGELKQWIVVFIGVLALFSGIGGYLMRNATPPNFYGLTNFENPADNVLHVIVGVWALLAAFGGKGKK